MSQEKLSLRVSAENSNAGEHFMNVEYAKVKCNGEACCKDNVSCSGKGCCDNKACCNGKICCNGKVSCNGRQADENSKNVIFLWFIYDFNTIHYVKVF